MSESCCSAVCISSSAACGEFLNDVMSFSSLCFSRFVCLARLTECLIEIRFRCSFCSSHHSLGVVKSSFCVTQYSRNVLISCLYTVSFKSSLFSFHVPGPLGFS